MGDPPSADTAHSDDAGPSCPLSSNELRRLVLDYLCQHCFIDTAKAFVKDWPREGDDQVGGGDYSNAGVGSTSSNGGNASGSGNGIVGGLKQEYEGTNGVGGSSLSGSGVRIVDSGSITASTGSQADDVRHTAGVENGQASENGSRVEGGSFDHDGDAEMEIAGEGDEEDGEEEFFDDDAVMNTSELNGSRLSLNGKSSKGRAGESDEEDLPDLRNETIRRIRIRKEIKTRIQAGRIQTAIDLCNEHFPGVLYLPPPKLQTTSAPGMGRKSSSGTRVLAIGEKSPTLGPSGRGVSSTLSSPGFGSGSGGALRNGGLNRTAPGFGNEHEAVIDPLDPSQLLLDLQVQIFVEIVRTASTLPYGPTASSPSTPAAAPPKSLPGSPSASNNTNGTSSLPSPSHQQHQDSNSTSSSTSSLETSRTAMIGEALLHAQQLHVNVINLENPHVRAVMLKELANAAGLLPYPDPEDSPVRWYLDQERRDKLAERVSSAILLRSGKTPQPLIEMMVRQTTFVWDKAHDFKLTPPPEKGKEKEKAPYLKKPVPRFNFSTFLTETDTSS